MNNKKILPPVNNFLLKYFYLIQKTKITIKKKICLNLSHANKNYDACYSNNIFVKI